MSANDRRPPPRPDPGASRASAGEAARRPSHLPKLFDHLRDAIVVLDAERRITGWNPGAERIYDIPADRAIGRRFDALIETEVIGGDAERAANDLARDGWWRGEVIHRVRETDREFEILNSTTRLVDEAGDVVLVGVNHDISERRRAERERDEAAALFDAVIRNGSDVVAIFSADGEPAYLSPAADTVLGIRPRHLRGVARWRRIHPDDRAALRRRLAAVVRRGASARTTARVRAGDGGWRWLEASLFGTDASEGPRQVVISARDVTERKRTDRFAADQRDALERIARNAPLDEILRTLIDTTEAQFDGRIASLLEVVDGALRHGSAPHLPAELVAAIDGTPVGPEVGSCGAAAATGDAVLTSDIERDPRWAGHRELVRPYGLRSCWSLPVTARDGEVVGTLAVYGRRPGRPSAEQLERLETVARLAGLAIEHARFDDALRRRAQHDPLTDLPNRLALAERMQTMLDEGERQRARRDDHDRIAALLFDLDDFKLVNDTLGHAAGDELLVAIAARLQRRLRSSDTLARLGGDEFVVLARVADADEAQQLAQRITDAFAPPVELSRSAVETASSVGIALWPDDGETPGALLRAADIAMYAAKAAGKNRWSFFEPAMADRAQTRLELETQLLAALERDELEIHLQPRLRLSDQRIVGAEALLRWHHPEWGTLEPSAFLPVAERSAVIERIDRWTTRETARIAAGWDDLDATFRLSINLSARRFDDPDFASQLAATLGEAGLPPERLELELPETVLSRDVAQLAERIATLRAAAPGVRVAIDDFGSGLSSLGHLRRLPVDTLKIDRIFVAAQEGPEGGLLGPLVDLGRTLGMRVVAEGVERSEWCERLLELGCHEAQGYALAAPMPADAFLDFVRRHRSGPGRDLDAQREESERS